MENQELVERICRMHIAHLREMLQLNQAISAQGEDAVLISLYFMDHPVFAGEFIEKLGLTTGRIANILKKLEEKNMIVRTADREDRRRVRVSLTEAGRERAEKKYSDMVRAHQALIDRLGPEDAWQLARILGRLADFANQLPVEA